MELFDALSELNIAALGMFMFGAIKVMIFLICYGCKSVGVYLLANKTKQKNTWFAFVPVLQDILVFNMAGLSTKSYIVFYLIYRALFSAKLEWVIFAPIWLIGIIVYYAGLFYARYQMAKNFGGNQVVCILNMLLEPFVVLYILSQKQPLQYHPHNPKVDHYLRTYGLQDEHVENFVNANHTTSSNIKIDVEKDV